MTISRSDLKHRRARGSAGPADQQRLAATLVQHPIDLCHGEQLVGGIPPEKPALRGVGLRELRLPERGMADAIVLQRHPVALLDQSRLPVVFVEKVLEELWNGFHLPSLSQHRPNRMLPTHTRDALTTARGRLQARKSFAKETVAVEAHAFDFLAGRGRAPWSTRRPAPRPKARLGTARGRSRAGCQ